MVVDYKRCKTMLFGVIVNINQVLPVFISNFDCKSSFKRNWALHITELEQKCLKPRLHFHT